MLLLLYGDDVIKTILYSSYLVWFGLVRGKEVYQNEKRYD